MVPPDFTIGIEEEYLLVDPETGALAEMPPALLEECTIARPGQISPEYLKCQIEVGTGVCRTVAEAREDLGRLRRTVQDAAHRHGLAPIAVSCHPFADWKDQHHTDKGRYNQLRTDLAGVARRMLICGMHVHVGLGDDDLRADLMGQFTYFLPHLLALSASSPFWQGEDTGLASYRLTVFDNLPRTGLPPQVGSWGEFERSVTTLVKLGVIEDASKIWWDLRPSSRFPTLETRICDVSPHIEATLSIAALIQSLTRMLWRIGRQNQRWRRYDNFLIAENRWRAQRYGATGGLIDFGRRQIVPYADLLEEMIELVREDAEALGCLAEVEAARNILATRTSSERQRKVASEAAAQGKDHAAQMRAVVAALIGEFSEGL